MHNCVLLIVIAAVCAPTVDSQATIVTPVPPTHNHVNRQLMALIVGNLSAPSPPPARPLPLMRPVEHPAQALTVNVIASLYEIVDIVRVCTHSLAHTTLSLGSTQQSRDNIGLF
jgi:hypothetical protein